MIETFYFNDQTFKGNNEINRSLQRSSFNFDLLFNLIIREIFSEISIRI